MLIQSKEDVTIRECLESHGDCQDCVATNLRETFPLQTAKWRWAESGSKPENSGILLQSLRHQSTMTDAWQANLAPLSYVLYARELSEGSRKAAAKEGEGASSEPPSGSKVL